MERPFDFEKKLEVVHKPGRINCQRMSGLSGTTVTKEWKIAANADLGEVLKNAVYDLQDYFKTSMEIELQKFLLRTLCRLGLSAQLHRLSTTHHRAQ